MPGQLNSEIFESSVSWPSTHLSAVSGDGGPSPLPWGLFCKRVAAIAGGGVAMTGTHLALQPLHSA